MLTKTSRNLTYLTAILYFILGASLFLMPERFASVFAWKVTPFMTMTIGAWCLGNAWLAWLTARRWEWRLVYSALLYLWLFGAGESAVVFLFREKLNLAHPVAWLYLATLLVNDLTAIFGVMDYFRILPTRERFGLEISKLQYGFVIAFIVFVGFLSGYGLFAKVGSIGTNGGIFPEIMSAFTLRSFAVFYFSVTLAVVPYLWDKNLNSLLHHSIASYGLVVIIILAAFVYLHLFNFAERPGGSLYFGAYFSVLIPLPFVFRRFGTGTRTS